MYVMSDLAMSNVESWRRNPSYEPFLRRGVLDFARFDAERGVYELHFAHDNAVSEPTLIFVPALVQYADGYTVTVSDGHYERDAAPKAQGGYELLRYYHTKSLYRHSVVISRAISAAPTRGRDRRSSRI